MKNKKILSMIIAVLFIIGLVFFINEPYNEKVYLNKNYSNITLEYDDFTGLNILSKDLKGKTVVLTSEEHGFEQGYMIKFKMLKYLQKEIGVNYLLSELGYADSYFINKYLETGEEEFLNVYFSKYAGQKTSNQGHYEFYKNVYQFNQTLPNEKQIKLVGVDTNTGLTYEYIVDILRDGSIKTEALESVLNELNDFDYYTPILYKDLWVKVDNLLQDIRFNKDAYIKIFDDNFEDFEHVVKNLGKFCEYFTADKKDMYNIRDFYMYENFKELDSKLDIVI